MNRKIYTGIVVVIVCLTFGLLTGCSSGTKTYTLTPATGSTPQAQTVGEAFSVALGVTVTSGTTPASGLTVTFAAGSSSGGATCALSATTATTDSNGNASVTCTANATPGAYTVTATVNSKSSTSFALTNDAPSVFVFDANGLELIGANAPYNYYAVVGAVGFDLSGNVLGGQQDYNDGDGLASPPGGDTISATGSSLVVNTTTGTAILTLATSNTALGAAGVETFAVQFANASHGVISQFDGSATSSGSFDLQTSASGGGGGDAKSYAFTLSGVDPGYLPMAVGGVLTTSSGVISGTADVNDDAVVTLGTEGVANLAGTDNGTSGSYGRGTASISVNTGPAISIVYYFVGPEVTRLIDMDATDSMLGSAYGQGSSPAFDSTALGTADVFGFNGNPWGELYAAAGQITPSGAAAGVAGASFAGEADLDDDGTTIISAAAISGTYTINPDGYGSLLQTSGNLENSTQWGVYATDPTLNLYDPNNTTSGQGGALVLELDGALCAGTGIITPQGTTTSSDFNNNSYAFGAQDYNSVGESDLVGQATFDTTLDLTGTGDVSDPYEFFSTATPPYIGVPFAGTASGPDSFGYYTYPALLAVGPVGTGGPTDDLTVVMYEANGGFAFWLDEDSNSIWLGSLEEQSSSSLAKSHFKKGVISKAQIKMKHR